MTFKEWWESEEVARIDPYERCSGFGLMAWNAAVAAERERLVQDILAEATEQAAMFCPGCPEYNHASVVLRRLADRILEGGAS